VERKSRPRPPLALYLRGFLERRYRVVSSGRDWAVLQRKKEFSIVGFLVLGMLYLIYYLTKPDERVRIAISETGELTKIRVQNE
jgi:hypothetical protein